MNVETTSPRSHLKTWTNPVGIGIALGAMGVWCLGLAETGRAAPPKDSPAKHPSDDHAREVTALRQALGTSQIDLFFEPAGVESSKPGLAGIKFVDVVDVTGKELLRFEKAGDSWLIDPDTVFAFHMHKAK